MTPSIHDALALKKQVSIRALAKDDLAKWQPLWDGYNTFYGRVGPTALPMEVTNMTWSRFFDVYEPMHALVAESDGGLLGLVHFLYHRSTTQIAPNCYLQDLFTAEDARGSWAQSLTSLAMKTNLSTLIFARLRITKLRVTNDEFGIRLTGNCDVFRLAPCEPALFRHESHEVRFHRGLEC